MPQVQATNGADNSAASISALAASASEDAVERSYAEKQGWVPEEKYTGPKDQFIDYKTYAQRAREINPIINERNRKLESNVERLMSENAQLRKDTLEALAFQRDVDKRTHQAEIAKLRTERAQAIKDGDGDAVNTIDDKIDKAKVDLANKERATKAAVTDTPAQIELTKAAKKFQDENPWTLDDNDRRTRITFLVSQDLLKSRPDLRGSPRLFEELPAALQKDYPELFPKEKVHSAVDGGGAVDRDGGGGDRKYTIKDLPKDARETCLRFVKNGYIKHADGEKAAQQVYVDNYFAQKGV